MFGENFPYTNFHDLNMDWIIKIAKDFLDQYTHIQQIIADGETSLQNLTTQGLQQLQDKADILESALNSWYSEHSEDIANQLLSALNDLNTWYTTHQGYLDQYLTNSISAFNTAAEQKASETIASIPSDYTELFNNVVNLTWLLGFATGCKLVEFTDDYFIDINNATTTLTPAYSAGYKYALLECSAGDVFTLDLHGGPIKTYAFVDSSNNILESQVDLWTNTQAVVTAPNNATHLVLNDNGQQGTAVIGFSLIDTISNDDNLIKAWNITSLNRFNKNDPAIVDNYTIDTSSGNLVPLSDYFTSPFIKVTDIRWISLSYVHIYAFYDENKNFVSAGASTVYEAYDEVVAVPTTATYIRISTKTSYANVTQIGQYIKRTSYVAYNEKFIFPNLVEEPVQPLTVSPNGGDYNSFTKAIYENRDNNINILVKPGTYNIKDEYIALFGADIVANMSDATDLNLFQFGIFINNKKITFEPGAKLVCDWSAYTVDGTHRFSVLAIGANVELIGLDLEATHTFYVIHDDYGDYVTSYENKYLNCKIIGINLVQSNAIGGGVRPYSKTIIKDSYIVSSGTTTLRYHNTFVDGYPKIYIDNCYFNMDVAMCYYGSQTTKMEAYISNCKARNIYKRAETPDSIVDNVDLFTWCNEIG